MHLGQCLEILELKSAESLEEVKKAYMVLVNVWHPDRFSHDSRLKQKAKAKIQEINAAYEQLESFFTDKSYKVDPKSISGDPPKTVVAQKTQTVHPSNTAVPSITIQDYSAAPTGRKTPAVTARTSSLGKYVFWGSLFGLVVFTILILHFLARMDESVGELSHKTLLTIQEKLSGVVDPSSAPDKKAPPFDRESDNTAPVSAAAEKSETEQYRRQCIIYLKSGDYIIAENWWYNGDMVEYRLIHGIVGIEKKRVKDIDCGQQ